MTKGEIETIANIIKRLKEENCGCSLTPGIEQKAADAGLDTRITPDASINRVAVVSRIYLDTWIIGALECLVPGEGRDVDLAVSLSRR